MVHLSPSKEVTEYQNAISHAGYTFNPLSRAWKISRDVTVHLSWVDDFLSEKLKSSYLKILRYYAEVYSAGHTNNLSDRFREFSRFTHTNRGNIDLFYSIDLINYRATLTREHEWYLGSIRGFLKSWSEMAYFGIDDNIPELLESWKLKGNIKGRAVQTLCPKEGALSDLEFEALHQSLLDAFELGNIQLDALVLVQLFIATGRRPSQLGDLKAKDLVEAASAEGLREFFLNKIRAQSLSFMGGSSAIKTTLDVSRRSFFRP